MALPKKDGGARPIAVGEVYRRLAAKTLCTAFREAARDYLWPLQIGVAQPMGSEVGLQVARQWCYRNRQDPNKVFVKLDCQTLLTQWIGSSFSGKSATISPALRLGRTTATPNRRD